MTPAARLQMAIEILEGLEHHRPAHRPLPQGLVSHPPLCRLQGPPRHRRAGVCRAARTAPGLAHRMGERAAPRALVIAALLADGDDPTRCSPAAMAPRRSTDAERAAIAATPPPAPRWVAGEYPQWSGGELTARFRRRACWRRCRRFIRRAPTDLRVNTLKVVARCGAGGAARRRHRLRTHALCAARHPHRRRGRQPVEIAAV